MNEFTVQLNFPIVIDEVDFSLYLSQNKKQIQCESSILKQDTHDWLKSQLSLEIQWLEIFCLAPYGKHIIHCDGHEIDTKAKINYIVGGEDSCMIWYNAVDEDKIIKGISKANTRYLTIAEKDAVEVYSKQLTGFNIVNVGALHTVKNKTSNRYCVSMAIADSTSKQRLDYSELVDRCREYI
jgi:hypothetical protein